MIDRFELEPRFEWLVGSRYYDEALGDAALAIELTAVQHGDEMMRYGCAWMSAAAVVEVLRLGELVESVRRRRAAGLRWPESFGRGRLQRPSAAGDESMLAYMKRTTVKIPDELDARLRNEAIRRGSTISEVTREALEAHLGGGRRRVLMAAGSASSGRGDLSERIEEILAAEAEQFRS